MYLSEITIPRDIGKIEYGPRIKLEKNQLVVGDIGRGGQERGSVHLSRGVQYGIIREPYIDDLNQSGVRQFISGGVDVIFTNEGKPLIVEASLHSLLDNRVLVVCHLDSGLGALNNAWFTPTPDIVVLARGHRWSKPRSPQYASSGKIAEIAVILKEGQSLGWKRLGRAIKALTGTITYLGRDTNGQPKFNFDPPQHVRKAG